MSGTQNPYTSFLAGTGGSQPSPSGVGGSRMQFAGHAGASPDERTRSVPSTPGASFTSQPGYTPIRETGPTQSTQPNAYQSVDPDIASRMSLEDILNNPIHRNLPHLDPHRSPGTLWFDEDSCLAAAIREIFERDFKEPHANFKQVPVHVVDRWFKTFAQRYHWEPCITGDVRKGFEDKLKERLCDQVGRWKVAWKKKGNDAMPRWFTPTVWEGLVEYWLDPKSEKKSAISRAARFSDPLGEGPHKHCSGQTSFKARARKIQEASGDSHPDLVETLYQTKRNSAGVFIDKKSERIYNEVTAKMQELTQDDGDSSSGSCALTTSQKNLLYTEVAPRKKGRLYGAGSLGSRIDDCISPQGFQSQSSGSSIRQELDQTINKLDHTTEQLVQAQQLISSQAKTISAYNQMFSILAEKDER